VLHRHSNPTTNILTSYWFSEIEEDDSERLRKAEKAKRLECFVITFVCILLQVTIVVLLVFLIFALEYCHSTVAVNLYWALWLLLPVGALVAMAGVLLDQGYYLTNHSHPKWNVAMGTPILVLSAIPHGILNFARRMFRKDPERVRAGGASINAT
jgi:hypothetical protein